MNLGAFGDEHDATQCASACRACAFPPLPLSCSNLNRVSFLDKDSLEVPNLNQGRQNSTLGQMIVFSVS